MEYVPPHSIEAEKHVLGSIIIDKDELINVMTLLHEDDFYKPEHKEIYKTILELVSKNQVVDLITVSDKIGNFDYLAEILSSVTVTANAVNSARIIKGKSVRRQFAKAAINIISKSTVGEYDNIVDFKNDVLKEVDIDVNISKTNNTDIQSIALEQLQIIEDRFFKGDDVKNKYGFYWIDKHTGGVHGTDLTIISARPSVGKTAFALQIAINLSANKNNIAIFSLEMGKEQLMDRLISNVGSIELNEIRTGSLNDESWSKLARIVNIISAFNINIFDDVFKIEEIRSQCRQMKNKGQLDCILIDYLQLCDTMKKTNNTNDKVSYMTRQFKLLAKEMKCPVILLCQLNRANETEKRKPKLIDLRDSGSIEQDADNVFFLHDPSYGQYEQEHTEQVQPIEFIISKQRNGSRDIYTELGFIKSFQRFVNIKK